MRNQHLFGGGNQSRLLFCFLTLLWMSLIFLFSSQPGEESTEVSTWVGRGIGRIFVPGFQDAAPSAQEAWALQIDFYVRKGAHFSVYLVLGMLLTASFLTFCPAAQLRTRILIPFALGVLYAASDEFHQLFVPGRSGQVRDVCIDSSGVMIGILLLTLVLHCARRLRRTC